MERLIADANEYAKSIGQAGDMSIESFSDVVKAIDLIQQKQGIAGTTAREAATTISGSMMATRAAWENLMTGLSDANADVDKLIDNVVKSATTTLGNLTPVIERAVGGISHLLENVAPMISNILPSLVETILPAAVNAVMSIGTGLLKALPSIIKVLVEQVPVIIKQIIDALQTVIPELINAGKEMVGALSEGMDAGDMLRGTRKLLSKVMAAVLGAIPTILDNAISLIDSFFNNADGDSIGVLDFVSLIIRDIIMNITARAPEILKKLTELISHIFSAVGNILSGIIGKFVEYLPGILQAGVNLVLTLARGIIENLPTILEALVGFLGQLVATIAEHLPEMLQSGIQIILQIFNGIWQMIPTVVSSIAQMLGFILSTILEHLPEMLQMGIELIGQIIAGILNAIPDIATAILGAVGSILLSVGQLIEMVIEAFKNTDWISVGTNIIDGIVNGITGAASKIWDAAIGAARDTIQVVKDFLGIESPSKVFRDQIGKMMSAGMGIGFEEGMPVDDMVGAAQMAVDAVNKVENPEMGLGLNVGSLAPNASEGALNAPRQREGIVINVYAREGQNEREIARQVERTLTRWDNQREAVWA